MTEHLIDLKVLPEVSIRCRLPVVIGVAGITCSGKTWLTDRIAEYLSLQGLDPVKLRMDDFFRDISDPIFIKDGRRRANFDLPEAYLEDEIVSVVTDLFEGRDADLPVYDIRNNIRKKETVPIKTSSVILVDGLYSIMFLRDKIKNFKGIYADAEFGTCLERRILRDTALLGVTRDQVIDLMQRKVIPTLDLYMYPQKDVADLLIDTRKEVNVGE